MDSQTRSGIRTITPRRLFELSRGDEPVDVIDVRTPAEYRSAHVPIARSAPLEGLDLHGLAAGRRDDGRPLYVMCRSGNRSEKACAAFAAAGYGDAVVDVDGGLVAWERAGLPVVRGRYMLPLDRQVRIATGILVFMGALLGYLVNPWFYALSAYCGAGLIFAGITDICPLSWTIAKMPWNQVRLDGPGCCRP